MARLKPKIGDTLPNGALIIAVRNIYAANGLCERTYVLCHWHKGNNPDGEYVSWRIDEDWNAAFGMYGRDLADAVERFNKR
jgi:hypothetical protein